ncbi:polysaccharide production protein [Cellulophaga geojensis KL-A]|uniref:Polysaccharide production protein n=1 Tax=Cellulophaga geojensis KL-A TaxID=1328323 RepID=A0ABN0RQ57_9FLAO|nr:oligosaccharide flippase family protein [Cellulophaga geojensis]EWH14024.1 polysaccharide production protein [Cellulophaga geojensis KL-A]
MSQLKKGALLTYVKIILTNVVGLVLTPFIVRSLGDSEYGVYLLVGSFVAYLGLMNLGINNAIVRYVAKYKAEKNKKGEQEFLGTTMWIYIFISLFLTLVGGILYYNFDLIFSESLTYEELRIAKIMFIILVGNIAIALPGGSFFAICGGYESFVFPSLLNISRYLIRALIVFVVLIYGGKAISIVIIDTILSVTVMLIAARFVSKKLKVKISLKIFDTSLIKDIFSYSLWVFLFGIVYKFQWNAGQLILGVTTDSTTVAIYGIGVMLGGYYGAFAGGINSVLIPRATQMVINKSSGKELTETMVKIGRLNSFILLLVLSGFILFGKSFILLWVGETYENSWVIALLLMSVMTLPLIQAFGNSILEAKRKNRFKSLLSIFTVGSGVIVAYFMSQSYGIIGTAIPLITAMALNIIIMNLYYKKIFDFKIFSFFNKTLLKPFVLFTFMVIIASFLLNTTNINTWPLFLLFGSVYTIICIIAIYLVLMNDYEKSLISNMIKFNKKK